MMLSKMSKNRFVHKSVEVCSFCHDFSMINGKFYKFLIKCAKTVTDLAIDYKKRAKIHILIIIYIGLFSADC